MAGIGFKMEKVMRHKDYLGAFRAFLYCGLIASGPWLISIASLSFLNLALKSAVSTHQLGVLSTCITYCYAISIIIVGPFALVLTRHAADGIYEGKEGRTFGSFLSALTVIVPISGGAALLLFYFGAEQLSQAERLGSTALLVLSACIFASASFLTSLAHYGRVLFAFAIGFSLSFLFAWSLSRYVDPTYGVAGFAAGHAVLFLILFYALAAEFGAELDTWQNTANAFAKFPSLILIGLFYNLGIWIDKILFWQFSAQSFSLGGWLKASPEYDMAIHIAMLTMIPGMAIYVLGLETSLARSLDVFWKAIRNDGSLKEIQVARDEVDEGLQESLWKLIKVQGIFTLIVLLNAENVCHWFGIGSLSTGVFRMTLAGAFFLVLFLAMMTALFYLDDRKSALIATTVFVVTNLILSLLTLAGQEAYYGVGFVVASMSGFLVCYVRVFSRLRRLDFHTFTAVEA